MTDFKEIADRQKALGLDRDKPFAEKPAPTMQQELNAKLLEPKPLPAPTAVDEWYAGTAIL